MRHPLGYQYGHSSGLTGASILLYNPEKSWSRVLIHSRALHKDHLALIHSHYLYICLFFILRGAWGGRVFDLATFICQSVAHNSVLKRGWEVVDGSFNRSLTPRNHKQKKHLRFKMESKGTTYETANKTGVKSIPLETTHHDEAL